jgi:hypothetical protein
MTTSRIRKLKVGLSNNSSTNCAHPTNVGGVGEHSKHIEIAATCHELADRFGLLLNADERYP